MYKIDKSRKGIAYGLMTREEREFLWNADDLLVFKDSRWKICYNPSWDNDTAYWSEYFDEPSGKELEGEVCFIWNDNTNHMKVGKVLKCFSDVYDFKYDTTNGRWKNAILATPENLEKIKDLLC